MRSLSQLLQQPKIRPNKPILPEVLREALEGSEGDFDKEDMLLRALFAENDKIPEEFREVGVWMDLR